MVDEKMMIDDWLFMALVLDDWCLVIDHAAAAADDDDDDDDDDDEDDDDDDDDDEEEEEEEEDADADEEEEDVVVVDDDDDVVVDDDDDDDDDDHDSDGDKDEDECHCNYLQFLCRCACTGGNRGEWAKPFLANWHHYRHFLVSYLLSCQMTSLWVYLAPTTNLFPVNFVHDVCHRSYPFKMSTLYQLSSVRFHAAFDQVV